MAPQDRRSGPRTARPGLVHGLGFAVVAAILGLAVARVPAPVVDRMIEAELRSASDDLLRHLLDEMSAGARAFTTGALSDADMTFLNSTMRGHEVAHLSLLDREERIFWSSDPDLVGRLRDATDFRRVVEDEVVNYALIQRSTSVTGSDQLPDPAKSKGSGFFLAEIDHPVILDGQVVGGIEFLYDVTAKRESFIGRVRAVVLVVSAVALLLLAGVSLLLLRTGRAERRSAEGRAEEQRALMAEQLRLAREVRLLGELNEWLQSSRSLDELFSMVARFMAHILPGCSGSLYVYSNSRDVLVGAVSWNGASHDEHMRPEDCWGLRRGRAYAFGENEVNFACGHMHYDEPRRYLCLPILAHGETVGLMTLTARSITSPEEFEASRRIAQTSAEQISLAVANVRMRDALHHQAVRDPLTGLFNRPHMLDTLRKLIDTRFPGGVALVSIDVDYFKRFNDNHGHDAGDMVLRAVGEVLGRHADGDRLACRLGGEELMLLLPGATESEALEEAERLRGELSALSVRYGDRTLPRVTVSIGVALHPQHGALPQEVIRSADDALYLAKARGRDQVALAGSYPDVPPREVATWTCDLDGEEPRLPVAAVA